MTLIKAWIPQTSHHVTADPTSNAVLNWVLDLSQWRVPKPPFSFYYPFQVIDIYMGPHWAGCHAPWMSHTLMSLSDSGLTILLCPSCLVLTSMPKQYTKLSMKSLFAFIPNRRTNIPPCLRCSGLQRLVAECFELLLLMSEPIVANTHLSATCLLFPPLYYFLQFILAFNSALDVK